MSSYFSKLLLNILNLVRIFTFFVIQTPDYHAKKGKRDDLESFLVNSILKQAGLKQGQLKTNQFMEKVIVDIYYTGNNFCAEAPILPGCISTASTLAEMKKKYKIGDCVSC